MGVVLDVTDVAAIVPIVARIEKEVGPIDVLINNAGYGHEGVVEETTPEELRRQFEVNVFGPVAITQAVLPYMRKRRAGHIVNVTSGRLYHHACPRHIYHGSKFALEGISEALGKEVSDLEPGGFRTDWAGRSMVRVEGLLRSYATI